MCLELSSNHLLLGEVMQTDIKLPDGWVFQDKVPARPGVDFGWWVIGGLPFKNDPKQWWNITECRGAGMMHGHADYTAILHVMCRAEDYLPPVESPDDWVPLIDKRHVLRRDIDWICDRYVDSHSSRFEVVKGYAGRTLGWAGVDARCLRKDHPDYQGKPVDPQSFRIGDTVRFRGGMLTFLVAWVAKDGMVRLADHHNPSYWCKPETLELVSRADSEHAPKEVEGLEYARKHLDSLPEWQREALLKGYGLQ